MTHLNLSRLSIVDQMPNLVNSRGFYKSKETLSKNHTLYQNFVENIHNMEHNDLWKERYTNPIPVRFGVFYRETITEGVTDKYFLFATNMKRTYENLSAEFTPYRHDQEEKNTVSTHGYGGIALPLKIGGDFHIYFTKNDEFTLKKSEYEILSMNIDTFMEIAKSNDTTKELPTPTHTKKIPAHSPMICFMEEIWGSQLLETFEEMNFKTFYVFHNPDLGNTNSTISTQEYLTYEIDETFQNQFIIPLSLNFVEFVSSYNEKEIAYLPRAFYDALPEESSITIHGLSGKYIEDETMEFMRPVDRMPNVLQYKYKNIQGRIEFENVGSRVKSLTKSPNETTEFSADFIVSTGQLHESIQLYSDSFTQFTKKDYTLAIINQGSYAEGVCVDVGDLPLTSKPIPHGVDDSSHLVGNRKRRTRVIINPENYKEWKASIYASEMKEDTRFEPEGILLKAIEFVMKKYDSSRPKNNPRKNFEDLLDIQKITQQKTSSASQKGNEFEKIHIAKLLDSIEGVEVNHNDFAIKMRYGLQNQGIDHVLSFNNTNITILIQDKLQQRISKDKIEAYVTSVKEFRTKFPEKHIYSLFINGHDMACKTYFYLMDDLLCNNCILKQKTETEAQFKIRIKTKINEIYKIFSNTEI